MSPSVGLAWQEVNARRRRKIPATTDNEVGFTVHILLLLLSAEDRMVDVAVLSRCQDELVVFEALEGVFILYVDFKCTWHIPMI